MKKTMNKLKESGESIDTIVVGVELSGEEKDKFLLMLEHDRERLKKSLPAGVNVEKIINNSYLLRDLINKGYDVRYKGRNRNKTSRQKAVNF